MSVQFIRLKLTELAPYGGNMPRLYAVQAIIFDLDGTLVDSAEDLRAAVNRLFGDLGLRPIKADEIKAMIGDGVLKLLERALVAANGGLAQKDALLPRFLEIYQANPATLTRCYPGVAETLKLLQRRGFRLAVVTNKPVFATDKILEALSLSAFFQVVIGGDSLPRRKPDPAQLLEAARQLGVNVEQTLMVGDNIHDVEAAHAAGMRCIAVSYGYHHRPPSEFNADRLIDRFGELLPLVIKPIPNRNKTSSDAELVSPTHPFLSGPERHA
jgi:phosphoglycolate phosphatase